MRVEAIIADSKLGNRWVLDSKTPNQTVAGVNARPALLGDVKTAVVKNPKWLEDKGIQALGFRTAECPNIDKIRTYKSFDGHDPRVSVVSEGRKVVENNETLARTDRGFAAFHELSVQNHIRKLRRAGVAEIDIHLNIGRIYTTMDQNRKYEIKSAEKSAMGTKVTKPRRVRRTNYVANITKEFPKTPICSGEMFGEPYPKEFEFDKDGAEADINELKRARRNNPAVKEMLNGIEELERDILDGDPARCIVAYHTIKSLREELFDQ